MTNYKTEQNLNDYELISLVSEQNEHAHEILIKKYDHIIKKNVNEYINGAQTLGLDENDLYQEGLIGLLKAIKTFNESKDASFYTYANICISSCIKTLIRKSLSKKNTPLNNSLSLDNLNQSSNNDYYNFIPEEKGDISDQLSDQDDFIELLININKKLTSFEKEVLDLKMKSLKNSEIAIRLGKDKRSIENALSRIRIKYKKAKNDLRIS